MEEERNISNKATSVFVVLSYTIIFIGWQREKDLYSLIRATYNEERERKKCFERVCVVKKSEPIEIKH
jgi:hypothetical protein